MLIGGDLEADQAEEGTPGETIEGPEGETEGEIAEAGQILAAGAEEVAEMTEERGPPDQDPSQVEELLEGTDPATRGRDLRALAREEGATGMEPMETEGTRAAQTTTTLPRMKRSESTL